MGMGTPSRPAALRWTISPAGRRWPTGWRDKTVRGLQWTGMDRTGGLTDIVDFSGSEHLQGQGRGGLQHDWIAGHLHREGKGIIEWG